MSALRIADPAAVAVHDADPIWRVPSRHPLLAACEVHVWLASVAAHLPRERELLTLLAPEERARADRFHFEADRSRYIVAHGLLRTLLARYAASSPAALAFAGGSFGKPRLSEPVHGHALEFNLSHSSDLVLIGASWDRAVGVDVERWSEEIEIDQLAEHSFSSAERAELRALEPTQRLAGFFACWTRKEAYIKATGTGVAFGLDHFDVSLTPGAPARLIADRLAPGEQQWTMRDLMPMPGYSGAVIAAGQDWRLERLILTPELSYDDAWHD